MNLCSDGHDEVCYDGRNCPACEIYEDTKKEYDEIHEGFETKIESLEQEIEELESEIKQLEERNDQ